MSVRPVQFISFSRDETPKKDKVVKHQQQLSNAYNEKSSEARSYISEEMMKNSQTSFDNCSNSELQNEVFQLKSTINDLCIQNKIQNINLIEEKKKNGTLQAQYKFLQEENRKANLVKEEAQRQLQVLRKRLRLQQEQQQTARRQSSAQSHLNRQLSAQNQNIIKELNQAKEKIKTLLAEIENLNTININLKNVIYQEKNNQISNILLKNQEAVNRLKDELAQAHLYVEEYKNQVKVYKGRIQEMEERIQYYQRQLDQIQYKKSEPQHFTTNRESEIQIKLRQELETKYSQLENLSYENNKLSNIIKSFEQRNNLKYTQNQQQIQLNKQLTVRIDTYQKQYKQLQQLYFKQQRQLTKLALNNDHTTNKHQMTIRSLKSELQMLKQQQQHELSQKQVLINKLQNKLTLLQYSSDTQSSKRKIDYLNQQLKFIQTENNNLKKANELYEREKQQSKLQFEKQITKCKIQKKSIEDQYKKIANILESKSNEEINTFKSLSKLQQQLQKAKENLRTVQVERDVLYYQKNDLQEKNKKNLEKIMKIQENNSKLSDQNHMLQNKSLELENKVNIIDTLYCRLQNKYKTDIIQMDGKITNVMIQSRNKSQNKNSHCSSHRTSNISNSQAVAIQREYQINNIHNVKKQNYNNIYNSFNLGSREQNYFKEQIKMESNKKQRPLCMNEKLKNLLDKVENKLKEPETIKKTVYNRPKFDFQKQKDNYQDQQSKSLRISKRYQEYDKIENGTKINQHQTLSAVPTIKDLDSALQIEEIQEKSFDDSVSNLQYNIKQGYSKRRQYSNFQVNSPTFCQDSLKKGYQNKSHSPIDLLNPNQTLDEKIANIKQINNKLRFLKTDNPRDFDQLKSYRQNQKDNLFLTQKSPLKLTSYQTSSIKKKRQSQGF